MKLLSYIEDARCLKVNCFAVDKLNRHISISQLALKGVILYGCVW